MNRGFEAQSRRIASWKAAFLDPVTGIQTSLDEMLWDYAAFRTAIRIVNLANKRHRESGAGDDTALLNHMLFDLLAKGYWSSLLLGVRKLLDAAPLAGPRGVNSVRAVLNDVSACQPWLTRRLYVEQVRECRYDLDALRQENWNRLEAAGGNPVWGDPALPLSEHCHKDFDFLSNVNEAERQEGDLIEPKVLEKLKVRLGRLDAVSEHVSTHVAHAGNAQSRAGRGLEDFDIRDAQKTLGALKVVSDLVGLLFANNGPSTLATYIGDQFEALDLPPVTTADMADLEANWRSVEMEIESWALQPQDL